MNRLQCIFLTAGAAFDLPRRTTGIFSLVFTRMELFASGELASGAAAFDCAALLVLTGSLAVTSGTPRIIATSLIGTPTLALVFP